MAYFIEKLELKIAEARLEAQKSLVSFSPFQKRILIFCILAFIPAFFISKEITFKIQAAVLQKTNIIAKPSFQNAQVPSISDIVITEAGSGIYSIAAKITNQNVDLSADNITYHFLLYNQKHEQIYDNSGKLFLLPGESKYIIVPHVVSAEKISSANVQLPENIFWQKRSGVPTVKLSASSPNVYNQTDPLAFVVQGTIYNSSPYQLNEMNITFLLRNSAGKIIAASERSEFTIKPFERRAYVQLWPGIYSTDVEKTDISATTDTLNANNISLPEPKANTSSDLGR